ncbi:MAG: transglycosylase domain-containing protein [Clostridia bacterium]|nr:transglycosylase domain-containing protein [Clostridia bacterium]
MQDNGHFESSGVNNPNDGSPTRNFEPISNKPEDNGSTRPFDAVKDKKKKKEAAKASPEAKSGDTKTSRAAKATAKGSLFVLRKILTYLLNVILTILLVGIITGCVVAVAFFIYLQDLMKDDDIVNYKGLENLKFDSALSTMMYYVDADGNEILLEDDTLESSENRLWANYEDIPQNLIDAYIAVEDQRFFEHPGVDTTRTASAIYNFFIPTSSSYGGGSTITQQLIKNVSGENAATIQRKVGEIFRALNVEEQYTKEEILEMYLNTIFLSHNSYGVRVAAQTYFGKELSELTLEECAAIASIGKWPTHYDPINNPKNNLNRRNLVLKLMLEQEMITQEEFEAAYDTPLKLATGSDESYSETVHSYYIDAVMDDVIADLMEVYGYDEMTASQVLYSGGLQIVTCLDPVIQECAEKVFTDSSYWPKTSGMQAQSAITIMDPETGNLLAIVGGLGEKRESRGLNRATQSKRQCGSSIKPVSIYALALDSGYITPITPVDDVPPVYYEDTGTYWPRNSNNKYQGFVTPDYAVQASLNTIVVELCERMGVNNVYQNFKDYVYTTLIDSKTLANGTVLSDINTSPLALGGLTYGVTVREHTQAYATLANDGVTSKARTYSIVRDSTGKVILDNSEQHEVKYSNTTTALLTKMMQNVVSGSYGTAVSRVTFWKNYGLEVAGKTGTTNDKKDVYFAGFTPDFVACCWYGHDLNNVITASGNPAASLWNSVFNEIYKYYEANGIEYQKTFDVPDTVVEVEYCSVSGKLATEACRNDLFHMQGGLKCVWTGYVSASDAPTEYCDKHVMVRWDQVTGAICMNGCNCPESNLINVGLRKITLADRALHGSVNVLDAQYTYMTVPINYVYPTDPNVPFFQNLLPEDLNFGISTNTKPANRVCLEHMTVTTPDPDPFDPVDPDDPDVPVDPIDPDIPVLP